MGLVPAVVDAVAPIPVVAAGGIADGCGLAATLQMVRHAGQQEPIKNFLDLLRAGHTDYVINGAALSYMRGRALAEPVISQLAAQPRAYFANPFAWQAHRDRLDSPIGVQRDTRVGLHLLRSLRRCGSCTGSPCS